MKNSSRPPKPPLPQGARTLALSQARAFAANATTLATQLQIPADAGLILTYLVNAGFAIELYLKTFMIAGRDGQIEEGHDLSKLLTGFPDFLKNSFNAIYDSHPTAKTAPVRLVSLRLSDKVPEKPSSKHADKYATFDQAIASVARVFVDARYFFERINANDWIIIAYPTDAVAAIFQALDKTYQMYESGELN